MNNYVVITVALGVTNGVYEHFIAWLYIKNPPFAR